MTKRKPFLQRLLIAAAFALPIAAVGACTSTGTATGSTCPSDSTLTYENFGQAFIASNCLSCHTNREQPTLSTQSAIVANREEIDLVAAAGPNAVNTQMPEDGSVATADRQKLGQWLACGAP
jgi:hypothetical protein